MARLLTRGHPSAAAAIQAMIAGTAPHAIVIAGPEGVGKTTLALDLAAGLLCDAPEPSQRPCRDCRGCRLVERGSHADLHRLAPTGPGNQIRIGDRGEPEAGTVRRLIGDLALLPVEGGARVALVEHAERMNEEAQSALLKTLEEPPAGVTIILCVDREDALLPTVRSRCVRIRLGPVAVRDVESILADQGVADPPTAARLARLASGRPGLARTWALAPDAVTARAEIARSLLDLRSVGSAGRLAVGRDLLARASDLLRALDAAVRLPDAAGDVAPRRGGRGSRRVSAGAGSTAAAAAPSGVTRPETDAAGSSAAGSDDPDADEEGGRDTRAPAAERRRAATTLVTIWRDLARDLVLVRLGEERRLRDPALLDDLRAAELSIDDVVAFLERLDRTAELIEGNVAPELAIDVLLLAWPRAASAA
jgi:DNA polymerase-3 subunit delta'